MKVFVVIPILLIIIENFVEVEPYLVHKRVSVSNGKKYSSLYNRREERLLKVRGIRKG
jgi:hypothetical protein